MASVIEENTIQARIIFVNTFKFTVVVRFTKTDFFIVDSTKK